MRKVTFRRAFEIFKNNPVSEIQIEENISKYDPNSLDSIFEALSESRDCSFNFSAKIETKMSGEE